MALTDVVVRNAKPKDKRYKLTDERGLCLEVAPAGGKWWRLRYQFNGKEGYLSLGCYPDVTLKDARDRRDAARKLLAQGINPAEARKAHKGASVDAETFEAVLRDLHPLTGSGRYVFPSIRTADKPMSENTLCAALRALGYEKGQMTAHGFRGMASTLLHEQGWPSDAIERQLAHTERNKVKAAYNHAEHMPERRKMMQSWGDYLDSLRTGGKIIPIQNAV